MSRKNDTSWELSEARTVLNRALTARDDIIWQTYKGNIVKDELSWSTEYLLRHYWTGPMPETYPHPATGVHVQDPDAQAIYDALTVTIDVLSPFVGKKKWKRKL